MQAFKTWGENLISPLINPAQFDFWAQQLGSTRAWSRCFAQVISVMSESQDTKTLTLKANRNWPGFIAGQHCNITATIAGRNITRSYSISSDPIDGRHIQITVRRGSGGLMSEYLCNDIGLGDRLELGNPFGNMLLPTPMPAHLLLLAAGSGITPMMSQIRTMARKGMPTSVTLMYWEKTNADFNFAQELQLIAQKHPHFTLHDVYLRRSNLHLSLSNQKPLLEQLEHAGISVPSGCRQGICNTCTCVRNLGTTTDEFSGAVDNEPSHIIKLCVSRAATNIELDL